MSEDDRVIATDRIGGATKIYTRVVANRRSHDGRLPLRLGPGRAPVDDLPDADRAGGTGAGSARLRRAVDQLPASIL